MRRKTPPPRRDRSPEANRAPGDEGGGASGERSGKEVGVVTSACLSPTLGYPIAMGLVDAALTPTGAALRIDTGRDEAMEAVVVPLPFYTAGK